MSAAIEAARLMALVSESYDIPLEPMRSGARDKHSVAGRRVVAMCMRRSGYSYPDIGRALGCDHTTAMRMTLLTMDYRAPMRESERVKARIAEAKQRADEIMSGHPVMRVAPKGLSWRRGVYDMPAPEPELTDDERENFNRAVAMYRSGVDGRDEMWVRFCQRAFENSWWNQACAWPEGDPPPTEGALQEPERACA